MFRNTTLSTPGRAIAAVLIALFFAGCSSKTIVIVEPNGPVPPGTPDDTSVEVIVVDPQRDLVEIDAATSLAFDTHRRDAYLQIARRIDLSREGQLVLVERAGDSLSFESSRLAVLTKLARHPALRRDTLTALYAAVDTLHFESHRVELLRELSKAKPVDDLAGDYKIQV